MGQQLNEPSMEDILASIKRIIADDAEAAAPVAPRARKVARTVETASAAAGGDAANGVDVLELTSPLAPEPMPEPASAPEPETATVQESEATPTSDAEAAPEATGWHPSSILSANAEQASRSAFAALSQLQVRTDEAAPNTLEGLVSDLLRPMLREWLDRELPAIVERIVTAEVQRVSGRG